MLLLNYLELFRDIVLHRQIQWNMRILIDCTTCPKAQAEVTSVPPIR